MMVMMMMMVMVMVISFNVISHRDLVIDCNAKVPIKSEDKGITYN